MNPELWRNISTIFLIAGIVFFVLTVWLSVNFHLVSIIKAEINNRKDKKNSDEQDYVIPPLNIRSDNNRGQQSDNRNISSTVLAPQSDDYNTNNTVIAPQNNNPVGTVVVSQTNSSIPVTDGTVVVSSGSTPVYEEIHEENDDFIISENIMVIHGDPSAIRHKVVL